MPIHTDNNQSEEGTQHGRYYNNSNHSTTNSTRLHQATYRQQRLRLGSKDEQQKNHFLETIPLTPMHDDIDDIYDCEAPPNDYSYRGGKISRTSKENVIHRSSSLLSYGSNTNAAQVQFDDTEDPTNFLTMFRDSHYFDPDEEHHNSNNKNKQNQQESFRRVQQVGHRSADPSLLYTTTTTSNHKNPNTNKDVLAVPKPKLYQYTTSGFATASALCNTTTVKSNSEPSRSQPTMLLSSSDKRAVGNPIDNNKSNNSLRNTLETRRYTNSNVHRQPLSRFSLSLSPTNSQSSIPQALLPGDENQRTKSVILEAEKENIERTDTFDDDATEASSGYCMPSDILKLSNARNNPRISSSTYSLSAFNYMKNLTADDSSIEASLAAEASSVASTASRSPSSYCVAYSDDSSVSRLHSVINKNRLLDHIRKPNTGSTSSRHIVTGNTRIHVDQESESVSVCSMTTKIHDEDIAYQVTHNVIDLEKGEPYQGSITNLQTINDNGNNQTGTPTWRAQSGTLILKQSGRDPSSSFRQQAMNPRNVNDVVNTIRTRLSESLKEFFPSGRSQFVQSPRSKGNVLSANDVRKSEDHYDFVLILQPQEVYAYWSDLLDFRYELLGQEVTETIDSEWDDCIDEESDKENIELTESRTGEESTSSSDGRSTSHSDSSSSAGDEKNDILTTLASPTAGVRRRRAMTHESDKKVFPEHDDDGMSMTPVPGGRANCPQSGSRLTVMSPGMRSVGTTQTLFSALNSTALRAKQQSLFDRAVGTPETSFSRSSSHRSMHTFVTNPTLLRYNEMKDSTPSHNTPILMHVRKDAGLSNIASNRRRWGNHAMQSYHLNKGNKCFTPPPLQNNVIGNDTTKESIHESAVRDSVEIDADFVSSNDAAKKSRLSSPRAPNEIRIHDIPSQRIARGIAARTNRANGMIPFLNGLKRGLVLRRHRPGQLASFCRMLSPDNGDTILFENVLQEEAIHAFKEQRIRFNAYNSKSQYNNPNAKSFDIPPWSTVESEVYQSESFSSVNKQFSPVATRKNDQKEKVRILDRCATLATKVATHVTTKVADIIVLHPASKKDPRSRYGEFASITIRQSKSDFNPNLSFSLVLREGSRVSRGKKESAATLEAKWKNPDSIESQFKYLDFEAATEGEYWLVLRGLMLLQRDAAVGRFAKHRAAGMGGPIESTSDEHNQLHQDEFHEPKTVGFFEKLIVKLRDLDTTYMEGYMLEGARPPPSDYFLGFRSPGTAIWSRLRQAGLETRRIYSLDTRRVMIKVRCPPDRLLDVTEVLRVKLKTKEGGLAAFQEDLIDVYDSKFDPSEGPYCITPEFQFSSSVRQLIINFIIGSRIRDSGAELGQMNDLGRMIQARVPLHMPEKLNAIYRAWFYFWSHDNWNGRDGRSLTHARFTFDDDLNSIDEKVIRKQGDPNGVRNYIPGFFTRLFLGCLYQPLDSIEQYFGEKVAFYFTWLQHTASHLVFLSIAGIIVTVCQATSNNVNHPIRPFFSIVVMLWTFVVLINWKKRSNFMAYRWGTLNYKEQETTRPQFKGKYTLDSVTGEYVVTYPKWKRWLKYSVSFPLTLLFTCGAAVLILWVHANRDLQLAQYIENKNNPNATSFQYDFKLSSIGKTDPIVKMQITRDDLFDLEFWILVVALPSMLGLCLPLLNFILMRLSIMLNDFENYRTESEYRTYLIVKVFSFRFVCYFATLYYYAFISVGDKTAIENGILRVSSGVLICTTVTQYWQNFLHVCFPICVRKIRMILRRKRLDRELHQIEVEEEDLTYDATNWINDDIKQRRNRLINKRLLLEQAQDDTWLELMNPQHDSFPEYIQAVVQFTFVACFSVVLPITPLIVLINHLISMRLDAFKLCKGRRRPLAEKTGGIGVWEHLLHIVAVISVLTNCWLMGFTSSQSIWLRESKVVGELGTFAIVAGWEHVMLLIKYILSTATSTLPKSVRDAMKKEQFALDQQRSQIMRARRQQRDQDESFVGGDDKTRNPVNTSHRTLKQIAT